MNASPSPSAWFAGPKAENGEAFATLIARIVQDYYAWRRNYFPDDGVVLDSAQRRANEPFLDAFEDRLTELLGRLKADFPFQSPRYAGHMIAEQTLPGIAGWFATMLYNPNNVTAESAPVTVQLELEAAQMIAAMLGFGDDAWAHLTSGGTLANLEALWVARTVSLLPRIVKEMRASLSLSDGAPQAPLEDFAEVFRQAEAAFGASGSTNRQVIRAFLEAPSNVAVRGIAAVAREADWRPVVLAPETHHYCLVKALDALGLGREALRRIPVDGDFRMRVDALAEALEASDRNGETVVAVVAVAGTTEEGAVDPLEAILDLRSQREAAGQRPFWLHVDAAYGGYLRTMAIPSPLDFGPETTPVRLRGVAHDLPIRPPQPNLIASLLKLGEADSIAVDPHKLGYLPYPAGAVCFRSDVVKPLVRQEAPYLEDAAGGVEEERQSSKIGVYILEGSKPGAAAAAVWLSHKLIPLDAQGHGLLMRDSLRNAAELYALLESFPDRAGERGVRAISLCPPGSNIVCYAFRPAESKPGLRGINELNQAIYARFTVSDAGSSQVYGQKYFVSHTTLSASQYAPSTVQAFLDRLGVDPIEYEREGVFLLRSVLMNPWYGESKRRGRYFLSELAEELYAVAARLAG